jgi:uncharacterized Zn finger protein
MATCVSNYATYDVVSSRGNKVYHVNTYGPERQPTCTCFGFGFRQDCKHISYVMGRACLNNPQWFDGNPMPVLKPNAFDDSHLLEEKCPNCGSETVAVKYAI